MSRDQAAQAFLQHHSANPLLVQPSPGLCPDPCCQAPRRLVLKLTGQRGLSAEKVKDSYLPFWVTTAHVEVELRWADCGCAPSLLGDLGRQRTVPHGSRHGRG